MTDYVLIAETGVFNAKGTDLGAPAPCPFCHQTGLHDWTVPHPDQPTAKPVSED